MAAAVAAAPAPDLAVQEHSGAGSTTSRGDSEQTTDQQCCLPVAELAGIPLMCFSVGRCYGPAWTIALLISLNRACTRRAFAGPIRRSCFWMGVSDSNCWSM